MEDNDTPLMKAMRLYFYLNIMGIADEGVSIRYRVEDIGSHWPAIAEALGIQGTPFPGIRTDANTFRGDYPYPELQWSEIYDSCPLYGDYIASIAGIMGYDVDETCRTYPFYSWDELCQADEGLCKQVKERSRLYGYAENK
jgi:hypothetical protein